MCPATTDTVKITIPYAAPTNAFAGDDTILCNADSMGLDGNQPFIGSGKWTQASGVAITIQDDTLFNTKINALTSGVRNMAYTITNGSCISYDTVQIEINAFPSDATAAKDSQYCLYSNVSISAAKPSVGAGKWSIINGTGAVITDPDSVTTFITGLNAGTYTFKWTVNNGICPDKSDTLQVTIDSIPTLSNAGRDRNTCLDSIKFEGNKPVSGIGTWIFLSGRSTPAVLNPNSDTSSVIYLDSGDYRFVWQIAKGGCKSSDTMRIRLTDPQVNDKCETPYNVIDTGGVFYGDMCGAKTFGDEPEAYGYSACNTLFYRFRTPGLTIKPKVLNINVQSMNSCNYGLRFSLFDSAACPGLGIQHDTTIISNTTGPVAFENLKSNQAYILVIDENRNPCAKSGCNLSFNLYGTALPLELISFDVEKTGINQTFSKWEIVNDLDYIKYELWCENMERKYLVQSINNLNLSNNIHSYQVYDNEAYKFPATYSLVAIDRKGIKISLAQKTLDDFNKEMRIGIYPNPASDRLKIDIYNSGSKIINIEAIDVTGKAVINPFTYLLDNKPVEINCKSWPNGIYNIRISSGGRIMNYRIVVIH